LPFAEIVTLPNPPPELPLACGDQCPTIADAPVQTLAVQHADLDRARMLFRHTAMETD